jgi:manganese oxidase
MSNRRTFLGRALGVGTALFASRGLSAQVMQMQMPMPMPPAEATPPSPPTVPLVKQSVSSSILPTPVITTDVGDLAYTMDGSTKVFHLVAEVLRQKIHPDKTLDLWGFNGSAPGPTIQVNQGDHVRVIFDNHLPEPSSIHWHGFEDTMPFDGTPGISQEPVRPGGRFVYEFDIHQAGTYFYHSHMAMQEMAGMLGGFIMHPRKPYHPHCDKDFLIHLQEYAVLPNNTVPNTMNMEYNWLVLNGKAGPAATPLIVRQGDRVRLRFVNLGMDHHPMHLHGYTFQVTGTEGGRIPETAWWPGTTVLVGVAQARDVEIVADRAGDWMVHCHLPHHMMNQMSSNVGSMTRPAGMGQPAGVDMNTGMGMLQGTPGAPAGDDYGTSLGRGMGFGSTSDMATTNGPLSQDKTMKGMPGMPGMAASADIADNANAVPGFPQDAYMEGPAMAMDQMVDKPENFGLRPGWSGFMMGMMTFLRVLPPDKYDQVIAGMKQAQRANDPYESLLRGI